MAALAAAHAAALGELFGGQPIDLLGVSTGGTVALQLAVDHATRIRRLVVATAASWLGAEGRDKLRRYGALVAAGRSGASVLASVLAPRSIQWPAALVLWAGDRLGEKPCDPGDMLATIDAECGFDVSARLGEIAAPTLIIGGARDRAFLTSCFARRQREFRRRSCVCTRDEGTSARCSIRASVPTWRRFSIRRHRHREQLAHPRDDLAPIQLDAAHQRLVRQRARAVLQVEARDAERLARSPRSSAPRSPASRRTASPCSISLLELARGSSAASRARRRCGRASP